ncbi:translation factor SUA5 [Brevinema andersonii]|uniref:Threonylcarbamoyl-AMP synthase n=1 Tax=Brevinema andersonii TaxID=34097 RepID=A0A1I1DTC6_BREAD|nr:L-threonylcarbamoyladenylate synthase [Brevinema andersonii]SFB78215.1 translation factor SUA5 [Brevinema andersonii]
MQTLIGSDESLIQQAVQALYAGDLVVFPTETVYGLGADATSDKALKQIFAIKGRPTNNPLIIHVASINNVLQAAASINSIEEKLLEIFAPGPLSLILPKNNKISHIATGGLDTVGIRIPDHDLALKLLSRLDIPIAAPSANISGAVSPTTLEMSQFYMDQKVPIILDGGPLSIGIESTVVKVEKDQIFILRPGAVTAEMIADATDIKPSHNLHESHRSPGTQFKHYQPQATVVFFECGEEIFFSEHSALLSLHYYNTNVDCYFFDSIISYAAALYKTFFECDKNNTHTIYCELPPDYGEGRALRDRIIRAGTKYKKGIL